MQETQKQPKTLLNFQELDQLVGVQFLISPEQIKQFLNNVQPIDQQPIKEQLKKIPNRGQIVIIKNDLPYTMFLDLIKKEKKLVSQDVENAQYQEQFIYQDLDSMKLTGLVNWFARFADLICISQYNQDWYQNNLKAFINNYQSIYTSNVIEVQENETIKKINKSYFTVLAEIAFCIQLNRCPRLTSRLIQVFIQLLKDETITNMKLFLQNLRKQNSDKKID